MSDQTKLTQTDFFWDIALVCLCSFVTGGIGVAFGLSGASLPLDGVVPYFGIFLVVVFWFSSGVADYDIGFKGWLMAGASAYIYFMVGQRLDSLSTLLNMSTEMALVPAVVVELVVYYVGLAIFRRQKDKVNNAWYAGNRAIAEINKESEELTYAFRKGKLFELIKELTTEPVEATVKLTNTEFAELSRDFMELYGVLEQYAAKYKDKAASYLFTQTMAKSAVRTVVNHQKGITGESKVLGLLNNTGTPYYSNLNLAKNGMHIELDGLFLKDNTLYTVEVKDYTADAIVLEASGSMYRVQGSKRTPLETVAQVDRHTDFIREHFGRVNIVNVLVFTAEGTVIQNHSDDASLVLLHSSYLPRFVKSLGSNTPEFERDVAEKIESLSSTENTFEFFDIKTCIAQMEAVLAYERNSYPQWLELGKQTKEEVDRVDRERIVKYIAKELGVSESSPLCQKTVDNLRERLKDKYDNSYTLRYQAVSALQYTE